MNQRNLPPYLSILLAAMLVTVLPGLFLDLWQAFMQTSAPHVAVQHWGNDYRFFFGASRSIWHSENPYADWFFTSPPLAAYLNLPLIGFDFEQAFPIFTVISILSTAIGVWLINRSLAGKVFGWSFGILAVILLAGFPFQFLVSRGNSDGVIFIILALSLFLLPRFGMWAGILLGIAISLKLYPIVLLLPLAVFRLKRTVFATIATCCGLGFLTWPHWPGFWNALQTRIQGFRIDENVSFVAAFAPILPSSLASTLAMLLFLGLCGLLLWSDWRDGIPQTSDEWIARLLAYFPLMIALPRLVHNYELIFAVATIPAVAWFWSREATNKYRWLLVVATVGAGFTQFPSVLAFQLTGSNLMHFAPAFGALLLALSITLYRFCSGNARDLDL